MKLPNHKINNLKFIIYNLFFVLVLVIVLCLSTNTSFAQESMAFTISAPIEEKSADPGQVLTYAIKAISNQDSPLALQLKVFDFVVEDNKGTPVIINDEIKSLTPKHLQRFSLSSWITPEVNQITLGPRETKTIQIIVNVPEDAAPGGRYAAIILETLKGEHTVVAEETAAVSGTGTTSQLTSLLALTVNGPVKEDALLKSFQPLKQIFEIGPVDIYTEIENLSDVHIKPKGDITIRNMFGSLEERLDLEEKNIFPYASKTYANRWDVGLGFGRYSASLNATWGSGQVLNGFVYFWIMPWKLIGAGLIILVALILVLISIRSHRRHKKMISEQFLDEKNAEIKALKEKLNDLKTGPPKE